MNFVDTHCHIQSIDQDRGEATTRQLWSKVDFSADKVIENANEERVTKMVCVGCDLDDSKLATEFVMRHKGCFASIGIHPHESKLYAGKAHLLEEFADLADKEKVVAIGECGLDYFYNHSDSKVQAELLHFQLELAQRSNLPVIFHVREAFKDFWPIFESYKGIRGVLHSFTDTIDTLDYALSRGLFIGVNGIATFAKEPKMQEMYRRIPLDRLLLETDAPFLTPTPYRGNINEPKYVATVAQYMAELTGKSMEEIAESTTANANLLFAI